MGRIIQRTVNWFKKSHPYILSIALLFLALITVIFIVFLSLGYSFTIWEDVRPDWEAIGTVLSFIAAGSAIWAAVLIPWQIAQKQNQIMLFEKKYNGYRDFVLFLSQWKYGCRIIIEAKTEDDREFACLNAIVNKFRVEDDIGRVVREYVHLKTYTAYVDQRVNNIIKNEVFSLHETSLLFGSFPKDLTAEIISKYEKFAYTLRDCVLKRQVTDDLMRFTTDFYAILKNVEEMQLERLLSNELYGIKE